MSVKKYTININSLQSGETHINIPVDMSFSTIDQAEVVERDFVKKEVEKAINPITDYEKVRFTPVNNTGNIVENIKYELNFLGGNGGIISPTHYSDIGFVNDDIKFRKNSFLRSFLRLNFYDSDIPSNQRLISFMTIFSKVTNNDIIPLGSPNAGLPVAANAFPVKFVLNNPISKPDGFAEGFYLYHFKDDVTAELPKELYMRAEFNNAKTGKRTAFMTVNTAQGIDNLVDKLHVRYLLKRDTTGFYYQIDNTYSTNIDYSSDFDDNNIADDVVIKLYEIQVL